MSNPIISNQKRSRNPDYSVRTITDSNGAEIQTMTTGMEIPPHDYIAASYDSTTDTYVYKIGGASGETVATIVVTYTSGTKSSILSVEKT